MKWFRVNLKQLLMLAVLVGLSTSFWSMLDDHIVHRYELFDFSPNEKLLLFEEKVNNEKIRKSEFTLQVAEMQTGKRIEIPTDKDIPPSVRGSKESLVHVKDHVRFSDDSHVMFVSDDERRFVRINDMSQFKIQKIWDLEKDLLKLTNGKLIDSKTAKWQKEVETLPAIWGGGSRWSQIIYELDPSFLEVSNDRIVTSSSRDGKRLVLRIIFQPHANLNEKYFFRLSGINSNVGQSFEIEIEKPKVVFSRYFEMFFVYSTGSGAQGFLLDGELKLIKKFDLEAYTVPIISNDGSRLLIVHEGGFRVYDATGSQIGSHRRKIDLGEYGNSTDLLLSGKGTLLAVATKNSLEVINVDEGRFVFQKRHRTFSTLSGNLIYVALLAWPFAAATWFWPRKKMSSRLTRVVPFLSLGLGATLIPICFSMALFKNIFLEAELLSPAFYLEERGWLNAVHSWIGLAMFLVLMALIRSRGKQPWAHRGFWLVCQILFGFAAVFWSHQCLSYIAPKVLEAFSETLENDFWVTWGGTFWFAAALMGVMLCFLGARFWSEKTEPDAVPE